MQGQSRPPIRGNGRRRITISPLKVSPSQADKHMDYAMCTDWGVGWMTFQSQRGWIRLRRPKTAAARSFPSAVVVRKNHRLARTPAMRTTI